MDLGDSTKLVKLASEVVGKNERSLPKHAKLPQYHQQNSKKGCYHHQNFAAEKPAHHTNPRVSHLEVFDLLPKYFCVKKKRKKMVENIYVD